MEYELNSQKADDWGDGLPDRNWPDAPNSAVARIADAWGTVTPHFALCPTLPLAEFRSVDELLSKACYRLHRLRPHWVDNSLQVAAIWERDGREGHYECGVDSAQVMQRDKELSSKGYRIVDLFGFVDKRSPHGECRYAAVWCPYAEGAPDVQFDVGTPLDQFKQRFQSMYRAGYVPRSVCTVGDDRVCAVW